MRLQDHATLLAVVVVNLLHQELQPVLTLHIKSPAERSSTRSLAPQSGHFCSHFARNAALFIPAVVPMLLGTSSCLLHLSSYHITSSSS